MNGPITAFHGHLWTVWDLFKGIVECGIDLDPWAETQSHGAFHAILVIC
jgi:hypothetical protein